jgi:hypothetical protein
MAEPAPSASATAAATETERDEIILHFSWKGI